MDEYPHFYLAGASGKPTGPVDTTSPGLETLTITAPPQFGGPEGHWSPETMLVASIANCFVLTFKAIARAGRFEWLELACDVEGKLDRFGGVTRFTYFRLKATLKVPEGVMKAKATHLLEKAENHCLITNSLAADIHLDIDIQTVPDRQVA
jgi:organic hydroperoxide reductase OsmC/OhrA